MLGIFKNIIKNDYIYEVEKVLEKKNVTNEIKSLIIDTLFKIEETYPNYKRVKVDVLEKGEYISQIIYALKKIDKIEIMKMEEKIGNIFNNNKKIIIYTKNEEETKELGRIIAKLVKEEIRNKKSLIHIALIGDLGVRKNEDNRRNIKRIWNGRTNI